MTEVQLNSYTWKLSLAIRNITQTDFGIFVCSSINALGKSEAQIRLQGKNWVFTL